MDLGKVLDSIKLDSFYKSIASLAFILAVASLAYFCWKHWGRIGSGEEPLWPPSSFWATVRHSWKLIAEAIASSPSGLDMAVSAARLVSWDVSTPIESAQAWLIETPRAYILLFLASALLTTSVFRIMAALNRGNDPYKGRLWPTATLSGFVFLEVAWNMPSVTYPLIMGQAFLVPVLSIVASFGQSTPEEPQFYGKSLLRATFFVLIAPLSWMFRTAPE